MNLIPVDLDDKYDLKKRQIFITGTQALIRLCLTQNHLDKKAGLNTAGYVTGYRGSPLGGLDSQFPQARKQLDAAQVVYEPALNEDMAATALWGSQQAEMRGEGKYDGVFGMWYGKGPGVDRSGDVLRHANLAGSSRCGGVLVLTGDDHTCESSTTCHQSEYALKDAMIPSLNPANVQEILEYGIHGLALSRFSGLWVGLKCVKDNIESTTSIYADPDAVVPIIPDFEMPAGGLNIRPNDSPHDQETRLHKYKTDAAHAYARANGLDRVIWSGGVHPRIGIVSTGKSYIDVLSALQVLGIDETRANAMGLAIYKVGMPWPLEPQGITALATGLEQVIVVEEKRGLIEEQLCRILFGLAEAPKSLIGKKDENGQTLFQVELALNPLQIASAVGRRLPDTAAQAKACEIEAQLSTERKALGFKRTMYFCAGCPHNTSTHIPKGARGYAGIGCSWMAQMMDRGTEGYTHMGGEGANWIGESKFSTRNHVFQTLGDGTYNHSGLQAIRAAIASKTNMTYKILFNDTVAMTGGQDHEGALSPFKIVAEVTAAGAARVAFMTDRPVHYSANQFPAGTSIDHRDDLIRVQRDLSKIDGVTVLVYEQTCAAEKRRRRKRGKMIVPEKRLFINPLVCEGCGDCGVKSNCVAITPLETEFGRKRQVDQSSCNKDYSCANGFCPSFVTVTGGALRKPLAVDSALPVLLEPERKVSLDHPFRIALAGVGGTGVVTIGALLAMATHLEGKGCGIVDMLGMAQKGGAVTSHIMLAQKPSQITAIRIAPGQADLVLGCDMVVSAGDQILQLVDHRHSHLVVNTNEMMTGDFTRDADFKLPVKQMRARLLAAVKVGNAHLLNSTQVARALMGDTIAANLFLLGVAYQKGLVPLSAQAIEKAIDLNGVAIPFNRRSFSWGRHFVQDEALVMDRAALNIGTTEPKSLDELVAHRVSELNVYQNARYGARYKTLMDKTIAADPEADKSFAKAVSRNAFKLMAYKDEYEVARLYTDGRFQKVLKEQFSGNIKLKVQMAPPLLSRRDPETGHLRKRELGPWVLRVMGIMVKFKGLRGTAFDPFGHTEERRMERALAEEYFQTIESLLPRLSSVDYATSLALASLPRTIRGFGHIKEANAQVAKQTRTDLIAQLKP